MGPRERLPAPSSYYCSEETQTYIARGEPAEADDFLGHHVFHITVNENGEVTAAVFTEHTECK